MGKFAKLTSKEISEKEFEIEYKGYKVEEVDSFLDTIVEDYVWFNELENDRDKVVNKLKQKNIELEDQNIKLKARVQELESLNKERVENLDSNLYRRLSKLEKQQNNNNKVEED
ncbi:DivIVA domain-containing protein [Spiroplasma endosymbiont of Crioceris asparagi]|uniref:DivIVA domain-containing protein n=1 Tax=Spiroplasma endosymbiont of Crioceris asparagi TaxID=3066286 RepID=UPI0030D4EEC2